MIIEQVKEVLKLEAQGIMDLVDRVGPEVEEAVNHSRQQIPKGRDETECPVKAGREPVRKGRILSFPD